MFFNKSNKNIIIIGIFFLILAIIGYWISYIFNVDFIEQRFDDDSRIGAHVITRVEIFQKQIITLSFLLGLMGILIIFFRNKLNNLFINKKELLKNIVTLIITIIIIFLFGEIILRIFFSDYILSEFGDGPGGLKFYQGIKLNKLGFRDIDHNLQKDKDIFRILIIGDSFTMGSGIINIDDIYPKILERKLNEITTNYNYEVIILAKPGYSTIDAVKTLEDIGLKFYPNLIILGYFANDVEGPGSRSGYEGLFYRHYVIPYEVGGFLYRHSYVYYYLESRMDNILNKIHFYKKTYEDYINHLYSSSNPFLKNHKIYIKRFISLAKENDIPVVILSIPALTNFKEYPFLFIEEYLDQMSSSENIYHLNMLKNLEKYNSQELKISRMDAHLNKFGHLITANILYEFLKEKNLVIINAQK